MDHYKSSEHYHTWFELTSCREQCNEIQMIATTLFWFHIHRTHSLTNQRSETDSISHIFVTLILIDFFFQSHISQCLNVLLLVLSFLFLLQIDQSFLLLLRNKSLLWISNVDFIFVVLSSRLLSLFRLFFFGEFLCRTCFFLCISCYFTMFLFYHVFQDGFSSLFVASQYGHTDCLKTLLLNHANVDIQDMVSSSTSSSTHLSSCYFTHSLHWFVFLFSRLCQCIEISATKGK